MSPARRSCGSPEPGRSGPTCVLVRATGAVHLLSTWDEGVPDDIPHENLYGISWNPVNTIAALQRIEGAATARRVGTDALSPVFAQLLPIGVSQRRAGRRRTRHARRPAHQDRRGSGALRDAIAVAESALAAAVSELRPGVSEQTLAGRAAGGPGRRRSEHPVESGCRMGDFARSPLAAGATVTAVSRPATWWRFPPVSWPVATSARWDGPGPSASTAGAAALYKRWDSLWAKLIAACRPGAGAGELLAAYQAAGEPPPPMPVARGLGMGFDPPVISSRLPATAADERLEPGMVLAVTGYVWEQGVGAVFGREAVLITAERSRSADLEPVLAGVSGGAAGLNRRRRRWPVIPWSTCPPASRAPTAPSCSPTAAPTSSKSSRQKVIRCGGGRPPVRRFSPAATGRCSAFWPASKHSVVADPADRGRCRAGHTAVGRRPTRWCGRAGSKVAEHQASHRPRSMPLIRT